MAVVEVELVVADEVSFFLVASTPSEVLLTGMFELVGRIVLALKFLTPTLF